VEQKPVEEKMVEQKMALSFWMTPVLEGSQNEVRVPKQA
jgi:hypothetical protein